MHDFKKMNVVEEKSMRNLDMPVLDENFDMNEYLFAEPGQYLIDRDKRLTNLSINESVGGRFKYKPIVKLNEAFFEHIMNEMIEYPMKRSGLQYELWFDRNHDGTIPTVLVEVRGYFLPVIVSRAPTFQATGDDLRRINNEFKGWERQQVFEFIIENHRAILEFYKGNIDALDLFDKMSGLNTSLSYMNESRDPDIPVFTESNFDEVSINDTLHHTTKFMKMRDYRHAIVNIQNWLINVPTRDNIRIKSLSETALNSMIANDITVYEVDNTIRDREPTISTFFSHHHVYTTESEDLMVIVDNKTAEIFSVFYPGKHDREEVLTESSLDIMSMCETYSPIVPFNESPISKDIFKHIDTGTFENEGKEVKMKSGGHNHSVYLWMLRKGFFKEENVELFENGVRKVIIENHDNPKRNGKIHTFFPKGWTSTDIKSAIQYVLKSDNTRKLEEDRIDRLIGLSNKDNVTVEILVKLETDVPIDRRVSTAFPHQYQ